MALTYGFYNSIDGDRRYDAIQMSSIFDGIIRDGIFMSIGDAMMVTAAEGMMVNIGSGRAWFNHTWSNNDAPYPVNIDSSEILQDRIDTIVLEINPQLGIRANSYQVIRGTPALNPIPPILIESESINQYALADIRVRRGVNAIYQADITNRVGLGRAPFVTGLLDTINIDALVAQWGDQWGHFFNTKTGQIIQATEDFLLWIANFKNQSTIDKDSWFETFKSDSISTFEDLEQQIRDILDQGAAGALLNMINQHINTSVNDENGVHGIRQSDNFIQTYRDGDWAGVMASYSPPNVTNFRAMAGDNVIALTWDDPNDIMIEGLALSRWVKTKIVRRTDRFPENERDGTIITENTVRNQYSVTPFTDSGLVLGQQYFYQAFPISDANIVNRNTANRVTATTQNLPPGNVIDFTITAGDEQIVLTWGDPDDINTAENITIWGGTKIVRKIGGYPLDEFDGITILDNTIRNQYAITGFTDAGLENGITYYYQAFPYSTIGAVNRNIENRISAAPVGIPPGDVINFTAVHGNALVTLTWGDPIDGLWAGTKIVRKVGSYPTNETDGVLVVDSKNRDEYKTNGFVDDELINDITYYYQAFPYSHTGAYNRNIVNRASATPVAIPPVPTTFTYLTAYVGTITTSWAVPDDGWYKVFAWGRSAAGDQGSVGSFSSAVNFRAGAGGKGGNTGGFSASLVYLRKNDVIPIVISTAATTVGGTDKEVYMSALAPPSSATVGSASGGNIVNLSGAAGGAGGSGGHYYGSGATQATDGQPGGNNGGRGGFADSYTSGSQATPGGGGGGARAVGQNYCKYVAADMLGFFGGGYQQNANNYNLPAITPGANMKVTGAGGGGRGVHTNNEGGTGTPQPSATGQPGVVIIEKGVV